MPIEPPSGALGATVVMGSERILSREPDFAVAKAQGLYGLSPGLALKQYDGISGALRLGSDAYRKDLAMLIRISPYWLWFLLSIPAIGMLGATLSSTDPEVFKSQLHPSGEFSARFMIIAMMASPLALVLRGWRGPRWLVKNRRYFGVAAFGYALLHTIFYLIDRGSAETIAELPRFYIWTGWAAFIVFIPLVLTSMDVMQRKMGRHWKTFQRWTYAAAVLTLLHWAALYDWGGAIPAAVHFGPLAALSAYRLWYWYLRPRPARMA